MHSGARAGTTIYCIERVSYYYLDPLGEMGGPKLYYLTLVGKNNPSGCPRGWPSPCFCLI
jgi:hypothetical protein